MKSQETWIYDSKQKHPALHTSERTFVPRTVIFDLRLLKHYIYWLTYCKCLVDLKLLKQIVDKVKAALDTAVGILNDKDGWKVKIYL